MMRHILMIAILIMAGAFSLSAQGGLFEKPSASKNKKTAHDVENRTDEQGRKQGEWMKFHPNGNIAYKAYFKNDMPVDTMVRFYPEGKKFVEIVFEDDSKRGKGQFFSKSGSILAEGYFQGMEKDSVWKFFDDRGKVRSIEFYHQNKQHGESRVFFDDGSVASVINYKEGLKDGLEKQFFPDGTPRMMVTNKEGRMHGTYKVFYSNGKTEIEGQYYNDLRDGTWVFYDAAGNISFSLKYDKGEALNQDLLDSMQIEEFRLYEQNRGRLKDPENFRNRPEEYIRGF